MKHPWKICLIMEGDRGWMGGFEYIKNLIFALNSLPQESRKTFRLCLLITRDLELDLVQQIKPYLDEIYYLKAECKSLILLNRIQAKIIRNIFPYAHTFSKNNLFLHQFLTKEKIDFAYPFLAANFLGQSSYRSAAWIPDFQHKYLPHFFSQREIKSRDETFSLTARAAKTIILTSKSAESDCQKFFPESINKTQV